MFDLKVLFQRLGLPLGGVGVIVALLAWAGVSQEQLIFAASALIGFQLFGSFLIDVLKYVGVVNDGTAGKWSAVYNLLTLTVTAVWLGFFPSFNLPGLDAQLGQLVEVLVIVFAYIVQVTGTKGFHYFFKRVITR